ncbi:MAG: hypothetical protein LJE69_06285 [Thiohalocapsa sp.]|jgi:phosphoribosylformylglycinamidine (FGAM) synthase-like enzyme|uniref:hypothetical protein n=1 Tax=Thiohalocapsa sp. TaxID=2497641 RepID=UPI0025CE1D88|nr:hypothetical protein [Thiohalocapsa sp.]MCG6940840.1 hypothetical protein [Thiohalocapsa sp.]
MAEIKDQESFARALRALTVSQQRQVGARFVAHVLDLSNRPRFAAAQQVAASADAGAAMLADAYHWVHAIYVSTHPRSDLAELDYAKQAEHFIAEALLICLAPTYSEVREVHIAEKAAVYCRMARMCANMPHGEPGEGAPGSLGQAEQALGREIEAQFAVVEAFVGD